MLEAFTPHDMAAIRLSLRVAAVATLASLPAGFAIAWILARKRFPGRALLDALVHAPLVLPPVVTGYALLLIFGRQGWLGRPLADIGISFSFHWTGAALAAAVMGFPLLVRSIRLSIEALDRRLESAASSLGAPPWAVFLTVSLPLCLPGILAGALLCFAKALGEFGATITFVAAIPDLTQTMPAAIYAYTQTPGGDAGAMRLALMATAIAVVAVLASEALGRLAKRALGGDHA
jgi:molybdate transport system permease protein